jgi:hypothetical protein
MNSLAAPAPRLTCRVTRGWIAIVGDDTSALRNSHVAHCADCQAFFAAADDLDLALRRDAVAMRATPADTLEQDIIRAVRQSGRPAQRNVSWPLLSLAGVAAAIAAVIVLIQPSTPPTIEQPRFANGNDRELTQTARDLVSAVPGNLLSEMRPQAEAILQQDPLQNEADAIAANARSAVRFLAKNFLPSNSPLLARSG